MTILGLYTRREYKSMDDNQDNDTRDFNDTPAEIRALSSKCNAGLLANKDIAQSVIHCVNLILNDVKKTSLPVL